MKLLACDDDPAVGQMLKAALLADGWEVDFTTTGSECLKAMSRLTPDAVILDRVMPGLGGMEVAERLRAGGYRGPILLFSAFTGPDLEKDAKALDVVPVAKVDVEELLQRLEEIQQASETVA